jgi:hypothetical protein
MNKYPCPCRRHDVFVVEIKKAPLTALGKKGDKRDLDGF